MAVTVGNPFAKRLKPITQMILAVAIIGLGFGMNLHHVLGVGVSGIPYTLAGLVLALMLGMALGKLLKTSPKMSVLLSVGTGVCGGSAIAAVAPVIKARHDEIAVSLAIVFTLNALALIFFPSLGHYFELSEEQFGFFSALAIHDTSSVLGATMQYGPSALAIGTTVKLARALWIVPVTLLCAFLVRTSDDEGPPTKIKIPWFIFGFLCAAALVTFVPTLKPFGEGLEFIGRRLMVLAIFLIGAGLTKDNLKQIGPSPLIQGVMLWIIVMGSSLIAIKVGIIGL